jgi:hypothetical protein
MEHDDDNVTISIHIFKTGQLRSWKRFILSLELQLDDLQSSYSFLLSFVFPLPKPKPMQDVMMMDCY